MLLKCEAKGESVQDSGSAMVYGAETWAVKKAEEGKLDVTQMRLPRWSNEDGENKK